MRETDGVMAEAALKLRLPPLRKDTLDWRDIMARSWWSKSTGHLGLGSAGENRAQQDAESGSVTQELQSPLFIL